MGAINAPSIVPDGLQADPLLPLMDNMSAQRDQAGEAFRGQAAHLEVFIVCRKHWLGRMCLRLHVALDTLVPAIALYVSEHHASNERGLSLVYAGRMEGLA